MCIVSPTNTPSLVCVDLSFYNFSALILNCSSTFFTSCTFSSIEALWFSAFSHTLDSRSLTDVAISSTSSVFSDVSSGFLWAFAFFLEPLSCSHILLLWESNDSDAGLAVTLKIDYYYYYSASNTFVLKSSGLEMLIAVASKSKGTFISLASPLQNTGEPGWK
jgi:hypothetical protein